MQELISQLPSMAQNVLKPQAPAPMKLMAASGKLPLPPQHMGLMLVCLAHDPDHKVAQTAVNAFQQQPPHILKHLVENPKLLPPVLDFMARQMLNRDDLIQPIILHKQTPNETIAWLAERVNGTALELIAQNQKRQLEHPTLVKSLLGNIHLENQHRSRTIEFALRQNIDTGFQISELRPYVSDDLLRELDIELEPTDAAPVESSTQEDLTAVGTQPELEAVQVEEFDLEDLEIVMLDDGEGDTGDVDEEGVPLNLVNENETADPEQKLTIEQQLLAMSVTEKIKTAMRGNKQIRGILIMDSNKLVSTAVLKNPRITENEVMKIASSRSVSEEIIRQVARNREWMKLYQVKVNLVNNPKCPQGISIRLLNHLRPNDLKGLVGNKNVPAVIAVNAKKLMSTKGKR